MPGQVNISGNFLWKCLPAYTTWERFIFAVRHQMNFQWVATYKQLPTIRCWQEEWHYQFFLFPNLWIGKSKQIHAYLFISHGCSYVSISNKVSRGPLKANSNIVLVMYDIRLLHSWKQYDICHWLVSLPVTLKPLYPSFSVFLTYISTLHHPIRQCPLPWQRYVFIKFNRKLI